MYSKNTNSKLPGNLIQGSLLIVCPNGKFSVAKVKLKPKRAQKLIKNFIANHSFARHADESEIQNYYSGVFYVMEFEMPPDAMEKGLPTFVEEYFAVVGSGNYVFHIDGFTTHPYAIDDAQFDRVLDAIRCPDEMLERLEDFNTSPDRVTVLHLEHDQSRAGVESTNDDDYLGEAA